MRDELFKGLTEEQIKKLDTCKDPEEVLALAKAEGIAKWAYSPFGNLFCV